MKKSKTIARSAVTGRIVSPTYAKSHPRTTVVERVPAGRPKRKK